MLLFQSRKARLMMAAFLAASLSPASAGAGETVFHLRNGDRVTGTLLSQTQETLVVSNLWCHNLSIPFSAVEKQEPVPPPSTSDAQAVSLLAASTNHPPPRWRRATSPI